MLVCVQQYYCLEDFGNVTTLHNRLITTFTLYLKDEVLHIWLSQTIPCLKIRDEREANLFWVNGIRCLLT